MIGLLCFVLAILASPFKSKLRLEAENAVLRHQLIVLRRKLHGRVRFTNNDRWFFIQLYCWFSSEGSHNHPARDARALKCMTVTTSYFACMPPRQVNELTRAS